MTGFRTQLIQQSPTLVYGGKGSAASPILVTNRSISVVIWVGDVSNVSADGSNSVPLNPGDSAGFDGSVSIYAVAVGGIGTLAVTPSGTTYSPGDLAINGPVTATISGPVTVNGTIDIGNTPTVDLAAGATVDISGIADVNVQNANIDVVGAGGFILPGQTATLYSNAASVTIAAGTSTTLLNQVSIAAYNSVDFSILGAAVNAAAAGTATAVMVLVSFYDLSGILIGNFTVNVPIGWNSATGALGIFSVPCSGSLMTVKLFNQGSSGTITLPASSVSVSGSYRIIQGTSYRGSDPNSGTINSIIYASSFTTGYPWVAQISNPTMTSGTTYTFFFEGYSGEVTGFFRANGGTLTVMIVDIGAASTIGNISSQVDDTAGIYVCSVAAAGDIQDLEFFLPPSPCAAVCTPSGTESFNLQLMGKA